MHCGSIFLITLQLQNMNYIKILGICCLCNFYFPIFLSDVFPVVLLLVSLVIGNSYLFTNKPKWRYSWQGGISLLMMQGWSSRKCHKLTFFFEILVFLRGLHFQGTCGGEGGEIGNIKTKNGQYLFHGGVDNK